MDSDIETGFIKRHVKKEYQERLIFELKSKKREKAISRFSHNATTILKNSFIKYNFLDIEKYLSTFCNINDECYIISLDENDGKKLLLKNALEYCSNTYMSVIIIAGKFVLVKEEITKGAPVVFISQNS